MNSKIRRHWPLAVAVDYLFAAAPKQTYISAAGDLRSAYRNDDRDMLSPPPWHTPTEVTWNQSEMVLLDHGCLQVLLISVVVYWSFILHCSYSTMCSSSSILGGDIKSFHLMFNLNLRPEESRGNCQWALGTWPSAVFAWMGFWLWSVAQVRLQ